MLFSRVVKYFAFLMFFVMFSNNSFSDCKLPAGVTTTPAWQSGTPKMRVNLKAGSDICWAEYDWCWRYNSGVYEIALGDVSFGDDCTWWENFWGTCDCKDNYYAKRELLLDYTIGAITVTYNKFNLPQLVPCNSNGTPPNNALHVFNVYTSKCKTVPYFDFVNHGGAQTIFPCQSNGFCKYEYKYCYKLIDGNSVASYTRTVLDGVSSQCPTDQLVAPNLYKDCLPEDCYVRPIIGIKVPSPNDLINFNDMIYYSL